jgi:hypothetical protein
LARVVGGRYHICRHDEHDQVIGLAVGLDDRHGLSLVVLPQAKVGMHAYNAHDGACYQDGCQSDLHQAPWQAQHNQPQQKQIGWQAYDEKAIHIHVLPYSEGRFYEKAASSIPRTVPCNSERKPSERSKAAW